MKLHIIPISTILFIFTSMSTSTSTKLVKNSINTKRINNFDTLACKNCIHFIPHDSDGNNYRSQLSKCGNFGTKDIITDVIVYEYADSCRKFENKCGVDGKYFELEPDVERKFFLLNLKRKIVPLFIALVIVPGLLLLLVDLIDEIVHS